MKDVGIIASFSIASTFNLDLGCSFCVHPGVESSESRIPFVCIGESRIILLTVRYDGNLSYDDQDNGVLPSS
jgi:hypothetical protein